MRGSVARSLVPKRKARPGVANGSIRGAVAAQAVEEENHSPASGGDTQIAQPKPKRRGRPSSPDSASKSESSAPEGTSSGKEDSNSEKHTSGSEVEEEEVDYGGSSGEVEEQKENQQQGRPLAAQAEETEGEEEKEEQEEEEESKDWSTEEEESGEEKEKRIGPPFKPPPTCRIASTACTVEAASGSTAKAGLGRRTVFKGGLWRQKKEIGF